MLSFLLAFLKKEWKLLLISALLGVCMALFNSRNNLKHDNALLQLDLDNCQRGVAALSDANMKCVEREAEIREDEQERDKIMAKIKTRQRAAANSDDAGEVIDDESRRAVIDRLNRPW